jgi:hypothetical protein
MMHKTIKESTKLPKKIFIFDHLNDRECRAPEAIVPIVRDILLCMGHLTTS